MYHYDSRGHQQGDTSLADLLRHLRQTRRLVLIALVAIGALFILGQAPAKDTVEADEFVVRDARGNVRARLVLLGDTPALLFYRADRELATVAITQDGLMLAGLNGPLGTFAVHNEEPVLTLNDAKSNTRAQLSVAGKDTRLSLSDANDAERLRLNAASGGTMLAWMNERGEPQAMLHTSLTGAQLAFYDATGPRLVMEAGQTGPGLAIFDVEGKTAWHTARQHSKE